MKKKTIETPVPTEDVTAPAEQVVETPAEQMEETPAITEPTVIPEASVEPEQIEAEKPSDVIVDEVKKQKSPLADSTIQVDKKLFYKMFATCVKGQGYTGHAAVTRFGAMLGANNYEEQKVEWQKAQEYLRNAK